MQFYIFRCSHAIIVDIGLDHAARNGLASGTHGDGCSGDWMELDLGGWSCSQVGKKGRRIMLRLLQLAILLFVLGEEHWCLGRGEGINGGAKENCRWPDTRDDRVV